MTYVVYGAPCAGKSTYASAHAGAKDLICDADLLFAAVSGRDWHDLDRAQYDVACWLRETLYDIVRERKGRWKDAYVISVAASPGELRRDMERVNADAAVFIDTPREVCMERAAERGGRWTETVARWFARHETSKEAGAS